MNERGQLWIVAAPSGGGKTSLIAAILNRLEGVIESVSHTTRPRRPGEIEGKHYYFTTSEDFEQRIARGDFLEYAQVYQHAYGTSAEAVDAQLNQGIDVILSIDWQGAEQVMAARPDTRSVFLLPPSLEVLRERLQKRGQDGGAVVEARMAEAEAQISHYRAFDYLIVNDDFERAADELRSLLLAARLLRARRTPALGDLLKKLGQ